MTMHRFLLFSPEVQAACAAGKPVVALESTIISHGMPYPQNVETARAVEAVIRTAGAVPATYGALIDAVATRLVGRTMAPSHTAAIAAFYGKTPASALRPGDAAVGWAFPYLAALLLNSPYFALR